MGRRRLPTGGLLSLAVVLAALAVIVVAGAKHPTRIVVGPTRVVRVHVTQRVPVRVPERVGGPSGAQGSQPILVVDGPTSAIASTTTTIAQGAVPSTTTTSIAPTTTTPTTTTTVVTASTGPTSRSGVFEGGATSATARIGPVRTVTVTVPPGLRVTLQVTCGLWHDTATAMTSVSLAVASAGAACTATFAIPQSSPQPAAWHLAST
jgi:hypothetical protein